MMWFRQKIIYWRVSSQDTALSMPLQAWLERYHQMLAEDTSDVEPLSWSEEMPVHYPVVPFEVEAQVFHQLAQEVGIYLHQVTSFRALLESMSLLQPDWVLIGVDEAILSVYGTTLESDYEGNEPTFKTVEQGLSALIPHIKKVLLLQQRLWMEHPLSLGSEIHQLQKELPSRIPLFVWHLPPDAERLTHTTGFMPHITEHRKPCSTQPLALGYSLPELKAHEEKETEVFVSAEYPPSDTDHETEVSRQRASETSHQWLILQHLFDGADDVLANTLGELEVTIRLLAHSRRLVESQRWPDTLSPTSSVLQRFLLREVAQAQLAMAESYQQQRYAQASRCVSSWDVVSEGSTPSVETPETIEASFAQVVSTPQAWMAMFKIRAWDSLKRLYGKSFSDETTFITSRLLFQELQGQEVVFQLTGDVFVWWGYTHQRAEVIADMLTQQWRNIVQQELFQPLGHHMPEMLVESFHPQLTQRYPSPALKAIVAPVSWRGHELFQLTGATQEDALGVSALKDSLSEEYLQRLDCVTALLAQMHGQLSSIWHHPTLHWLTRHGQLSNAPFVCSKEKDTSSAPSHEFGMSTTKTVWIGMKDPTIQQLMALSLSLEGWQVESLETLRQTFEHTGQCPVIQVLHQWVLADMTETYMPFLEVLRVHYPQLTLVTCGTEGSHRDRALYQLGSELHATHPFSLLELMKWVSLRYPVQESPLK
ncbi:MAG: hypothetical protein ACKO37_06405 [Vampirovibrionales bacterium]